jgi:hypothetical protein
VIKQKHPYSLLNSIVALTLLGIYLGVFLTNNLSDFVSFSDHSHEHEICTPELEKDSCHRNVFHNDIEAGCDHKTHFHPPKSNINFYKAVVASHFSPQPLTFEEIHLDIFIQKHIYTEPIILKNFGYSFSQRGPPLTA